MQPESNAASPVSQKLVSSAVLSSLANSAVIVPIASSEFATHIEKDLLVNEGKVDEGKVDVALV